jgi:hypothetical protein
MLPVSAPGRRRFAVVMALGILAITLLAASLADARGRAGLSERRSVSAAACLGARPTARAKGAARRSGRINRCRTSADRAADSRASSSLYWGSWVGKQFTGEEGPWDMNAVSQFESAVGKPLSLVHFSSPFANCGAKCTYYPFPTEAMEGIRGHGAIPFFSWASATLGAGLDQPEFQLSDVLSGSHDEYIRKFAEEARDWGHPFFLRFNWEMNGNWFPWSEGVNGNNPGEYVSAWRHVHDIFTSVGASNATWVWCPNVDPTQKFLDLGSLYPGDDYVDWTCLDGYNWGTNPVSPRGWSTFDQLFESSYQRITQTIAPSKPMVIGEVGSSEYGGSKAQWIEEMLEELPVKYPRIHGLMWFDKWEESMDWPLDSSSTATQAFGQGIQDSAYTSNVYGSLAGGPIQPPS